MAHQFIWTLLLVLYFFMSPLVEASGINIPRLPENLQDFKCEEDDIGFHFNLTELAGYWYEALRIPNDQSMECLNVSIPSEPKANNLTLDLSYVRTVNNSWELSQEVVSFPWTNSTQYGIFDLGTESVSYKLVTTDYVSISVVCGYGSTSVIPIFKLFSRTREVSQELYELINTQAEVLGYSSLISWEKQSLEECGGSSGQAPLAALMSFVAFSGLILRFT
ncbi:uncharacterized protein LOC108098000 [Drosophila ficusphila]|uniref:uncharacterized protein LOC108098000 n=1 Tax=Drosophila ficusphila TaxID=30025 RepID=UPI0007E757C9|nr:uncharacterized protein LOC108098000 [Drosophila ficusphila]